MARITTLNMQLPNTSPAAMSGTLKIVAELIPVTSSGSEVTEAIRITPTHVLPSPVFSAMTSPYFEDRCPISE